MKIDICDICYFEGNKTLQESVVRIGYPHGEKIDLCENHRGWAEGKSKDEFYRALSESHAKFYKLK